MVMENTAGIATGIEATSRTRTNCRMLNASFEAPIVGDNDVMIDFDRDHDHREHDGENNQEVADLEHRLLRVAHRAGAGDELGGAPEKGVRARRDDDA